jgi:hypothetical protein
MRRFVLTLLLVLSAAVSASAQTSFYTDRAIMPESILGAPLPVAAPIPYAQVRVCGLPLTQTSPCLPLASITDINGNPISNSIGGSFGQVIADVTGRYTFGCTVNTNYQVQVTQQASNTPASNYPITCPGAGANPTFSTLSVTGSVTLSGNVTANNAAGAGANDITLGVLNRVRWVCGNGTGYRFPTIESSLTDIQTNNTQGGFSWVCPDNTTDTFTTQNEIGSATKTSAVELHPGNNWTCKVTTGGSSYCWGVHNGSAVYGSNNGTQGSIAGSRTGGAYFYYDCTAKTSYGLTTSEGIGGIQGYGLVKNIWMEGCPTGTVAGGGSPSVALFNWQGISSMNELANFQINTCANTTCIRLASDGSASANVLGPIVGTNLWADAGGRTGGNPWLIQGSSVSAILPTTLVGGVCNHPGSGIDCMTIDFTANANASWGGHITGMYFEELVNGNSLMVHAKDMSNWLFDGIASATLAGDTMFDLSTDGTARGCSNQITNLRMNAPTAVGYNNHTSGTSFSGFLYYPFIHYGGKSNSCNIAPVIIDDNNLALVGGSLFHMYKTIDATIANYTRVYIDTASASMTLGTQHAGTGVAMGMQLNSDSGNITTQSAGVNEFQFSNNFLKCLPLSCHIGNASNPMGDITIGTAATNNFLFSPAATSAARTVSIPDPGVNVNLAFDLTATSAAFATATTAGTCVQNTTAVSGAATTMAVVVSPVSTPGVGAVWSAFVSSAGNVTINECAVATSAGGTIAFNIRVIP